MRMWPAFSQGVVGHHGSLMVLVIPNRTGVVQSNHSCQLKPQNKKRAEREGVSIISCFLSHLHLLLHAKYEAFFGIPAVSGELASFFKALLVPTCPHCPYMKAVVRSRIRQCKDHAKHVSVFHIEPLSSGFPSEDPSSIPLMLQLPPGIPTQTKHTYTHILSRSAAVVCSLQQTSTAAMEQKPPCTTFHYKKKKKKTACQEL